MGKITSISWTNYTWNPWIGCSKVSPGCDGCYMFAWAKARGWNPEIVQRSKTTFRDPLKWAVPGFVFTCSLSDFFHRGADGWRLEAWDIMRRTPHLTYQVLTKRPGLAVAWYK
jgi:protein gp37